jgi:hypothetical protein
LTRWDIEWSGAAEINKAKYWYRERLYHKFDTYYSSPCYDIINIFKGCCQVVFQLAWAMAKCIICHARFDGIMHPAVSV